MQKSKLQRLIGTDNQLLVWVFLLFTLISGIQFLQYFIAYNSSYPFPWRWNLGLTFGTFYTYFLWVPLILLGCRWFKSKQLIPIYWWTAHVVLALVVSLAHLAMVNFIEWWQIRSFSEVGFIQSYRWKLARYLHLEVLMYAFITGIWYGTQLLRWRSASKGKSTGELETSEPKLTRIRVKEGGEISYIAVNEIRWLTAYDNYVKCHVQNGYVLVRATLSGLEKRLDREQFQRIHRSCVVAMKEVVKIRSKAGKHTVVLQDETELSLSKTYKAALENRLGDRVQA